MKLYKTLEQQLKKEPNFVADNGELKKWVVLNKAQNFDEELIGLLLDNTELKEKFFLNIKGTLVFNQNLFVQFLEQKNFLNDSYTQYKNKVGLTIDGKYLKQRNEVALVWPFKDCILEGGQSREEQNREEIFFNEILAQDEITQLLEPKVLTNAKEFEKDGEKPFIGFTRDAILNKKRGLPEDTITDNLIIKGNNLLTLHTLKEEFAGKVKLIYIDPPYNTSGAANTFTYNNTFNHSSWLTFMKNRLDISKRLLRSDGIIMVAIDHFELFYLGALLDEIFDRENRMGVIAVVHNPGGRQDDKFFPTAHENMLVYARDIAKAEIFTLGNSDEKIAQFKLKDKFGLYKLRGFRRSGSNSRRVDRPALFYPIYYNKQKNTLSIERTVKEDIELLPIDEQNVERCWRWGQKTFQEKVEKYIEVKETKNGFEIYTKERESDYQGEKAKTIWNKSYYTGQTGTNELKNAFGNKVFSYPKSPFLIRDVLQISTKKNDIVLDFFGGSGTTAAVAKEMNRQFLTIEQMGYAEPVIKERLSKVVQGQKSGISDSVDWQGGGSFIYIELKKYNQTFIEHIEEAKDTEALLQIWEQMKSKSFLNYNVDLKKQDEHLEEFKALSLAEQKQHLCELLDKNQLYVNLSSLNDADFACTEEEKKVTQDFYQIKN
jgi:adenine-specific DNA-methyltransferase